MATRSEIRAAAQAHVNGLATEALMTPREQAEAAWTPGCGRSVDELEQMVRAERGLPPLHHQQAV